MVQAFLDSPLLLLFVVIAIGYAIGNIAFKGAKLGVAAVLFVGLAFGALDSELMVPEVIITLGLSIFVYSIGITSGPSFFRTLARRGPRDISFSIIALLIFFLCTLIAFFILDLNKATAAGLLAGSVTSTPALAGVLDIIGNASSAQMDKVLFSDSAVIGYSLAYPMGVIGVMIAYNIFQKVFKIDLLKEQNDLQKEYPVSMQIVRKTVEVTRSDVAGMELRDLFIKYHRRLVFGRMSRNGKQFLPNMDTEIQLGDKIVVVGGGKIVDKAVQGMGRLNDSELTFDRRHYDARKIFVSNPKLAGEKIASLNLSERFSAIITRVQRGDSDMIAQGETVLELGDRVQMVVKRKDIDEINELFGNSYESLSHINLFSFGLGMAIGLLIGKITFSLPGGVDFQLGYAGGPLLVALVLGAIRKTGRILWILPFSANLTLRQIGLILLLAGIGIKSGHTFKEVLLSPEGGYLFLTGGIIVIVSTLISLVIGYKLFKIPFSLLSGMLANQPAILEFALDKTQNKLPAIGYTMILPVTLILKILLVQVLFYLL